MNSFTSNFNQLRVVLYLLVVIFIGIILFRYPNTLHSEPEIAPSFSPAIKNSLNQKKPDLILMGNSILYKNVNIHLLESLLEKKGGRPVDIQFITNAGAYTAWAYLVIKNQILTSDAPRVPVGYFYRGFQLTSPLLDFQGEHTVHIEQQLREDESVLMSKIDSFVTRVKIFYHVNSFRKSISLSILNDWIRTLLFWESFDRNPNDILKDRFKLEFRNPTKNVGLVKKEKPNKTGTCDDFDECIEKSFLPDMISLLGKERLFFVKIHEKPTGLESSKSVAYAQKLRNYFDQKGIKHISLSDVAELNDPGLYVSDVYLSEEGQGKNTVALANEITRNLLE